MDDLIYHLEDKSSAPRTEIANLKITDKRGNLIFIVRVNAVDSVTLEIINFDEYSDYLGYGVKAAKIIKSAKCADFDAVKVALGNLVNNELQEAK